MQFNPSQENSWPELESIATPSRDDFAAMLEESFVERAPAEGSVVRGHDRRASKTTSSLSMSA